MKIGPRFQVAGGSPAHVFEPSAEDLVQVLRIDQQLRGEDGLLRLLPLAAYEVIPRPLLSYWAMLWGYWILPTVELVAWVREQLGDRPAVEVAAGAGVLGRALGIACIDWNTRRHFPEIALITRLAQQRDPARGAHVLDEEAWAAIVQRRPRAVVAAYPVQRVYEGDPAVFGGSRCGIEEWRIVRSVERYLVLGSAGAIGKRKISRLPHRRVRAPGLVTRCLYPEEEYAWIWDNHHTQPFEHVAALPSRNSKGAVVRPLGYLTKTSSHA